MKIRYRHAVGPLFAIMMIATCGEANAFLAVPQGGGPPGGTYDGPSPIPPEKLAVSPGDVDMRTGTYKSEATDLTIGENGDGGIQLVRSLATETLNGAEGLKQNFGEFFTHNWGAQVVEKRIQVLGAYSPADYDYQISIVGSGAGDSFRAAKPSSGLAANFVPTSPESSATLSVTPANNPSGAATYTYTARDGTKILFRQFRSLSSAADCEKVGATRCAFASKMTKVDGTEYTFEYDSANPPQLGPARLRSVTSNKGFSLLFEYFARANNYDLISKACVLNLAVTPKPASNICPSGVPTSTYTYSGNTLTAATDAGGGVHQFAKASSPTSFSLTKPGQAAPFVNVEYAPTYSNYTNAGSFVVLKQQFTGGATYNYSFTDYSFPGEDPMTEVAGGSFVDNLGNVASVVYNSYLKPNSNDPTGYITPGPEKIIDQLGRTTTGDYCEAYSGGNYNGQCVLRNLKSWTDPEGNRRSFLYDNRKNITQINLEPKPGSGLPSIITSANYICAPTTACDKPSVKTDAKGNVSNFTYDPVHGGVLTETGPAGVTGGIRPQKRYTYAQYYASIKNASGVYVQAATPVWLVSSISECRTLASCVGTADETKTTFAYGSTVGGNNLLLTSQTVAAGDNSISATTNWTYDAQGNKLTEDGLLAGTADTTRLRYDVMRRVVGQVSPDPDGAGPRKHPATRNTYDLAGRLIKAEQGTVNSQSDPDWAAFTPLQAVDSVYDIQSRKTRESKSAGGTTYALTQYSYDALGRLECTAVRMNIAAYTTLPASACTLGTEGTEGPDRITKLTYNAASELIKTTVAFGTPHQADDESNSYTPNGKLATVTDGENNRTTFEYDGHDRLAKMRYPVAAVGALASSTTDYEQATYDANSNITQRRLRDGQLINFTYDNLNRQITKDVPNIAYYEYDKTYAYDLMGRPTAINDPSGNITYTYDGFGRRLTETISGWGTKTSAYDLAGRRTRLTHNDGFYVDYDYDMTGNVTQIRENGATSGQGLLAAYAYDDLGRKTSLTRGNGTITSYSYDPVSRLTGFTHDLTGTAQDLSVNNFTYNPASQITGYARSNDIYAWAGHYNIARSYGTNGLNQLTSAGATALGYDLRGNLTSSGADAYAYTSENRMSRGKGAYLGYDGAGRLLFTTNAAVTQTTYFDYDGDKLALERNSGGGAILRRYVYGPGDDNPLVWYEGAGTTNRSWLHADERGSVVAVTNSTGATVAINSYDEYGIPASTNIGRFQYTGQTWLPEIGMYYYKARIYSPTLGRFMQTDPIGYKDGINWYDYVANDPVNRVDPTGLESPCITLNSGCWGDRNDPETAKREERAGMVMTGVAVVATAAVAWEYVGAPAARFLFGRAATSEVLTGRQASTAFNAAWEKAGFSSAKEVGNVVGWGGGRNAAAQATARIADITKSAVAGMREHVYRAGVAEGTGGATAAARLKLMEQILKKW
jgi:RHS repeat-associated protein